MPLYVSTTNKGERMHDVNAEDVAFVIELANKIRSGKGQVLLKDKLPYTKHVGNAKQCVLAKALNFDCQIAPMIYFFSEIQVDNNPYLKGFYPMNEDDNPWFVGFPANRKRAAEIIADALGEAVVDVDSYEGTKYHVVLPEEMVNIATSFDNDWRNIEDFMESPTPAQATAIA